MSFLSTLLEPEEDDEVFSEEAIEALMDSSDLIELLDDFDGQSPRRHIEDYDSLYDPEDELYD